MTVLVLLAALLGFPGAAESTPGEDRICIAFAGDLMAHCTQSTGASEAAGDKGFDFSASFDKVTELLAGADLAVGNLETPLDGRRDGYCFPLFSAPVEYADALKAAGFDVLLVANNHALDRREEGLSRTMDAVTQRGMHPVGATPDAADISVELKGHRVGLLGFTTFVNLRCRSKPCPTLVSDASAQNAVVARVEELRKTNDVVIVLLHWMSEDRVMPTREEKVLAARLSAAGAQAVIGTHSHVLGPAECLAPEGGDASPAQATPASGSEAAARWQAVPCHGASAPEKYVRYSLGNFVHAMKRFPTKLGGIDTVCFAPGADGAYRVESVRFTPTMTARNGGKPRSFQAVPLAELETACSGDARTRRAAGVDCDEVRDYRKFLDKRPTLTP